MKFKDINQLDMKIENIINYYVKSYYTDWKNYDRPYYMKCKGSTRAKEKELILIARKYGSYLYTLEDLETVKFCTDCIDYYYNQERENTHFYKINLKELSINKITDKEIEKLIRTQKEHWTKKEAA